MSLIFSKQVWDTIGNNLYAFKSSGHPMWKSFVTTIIHTDRVLTAKDIVKLTQAHKYYEKLNKNPLARR